MNFAFRIDAGFELGAGHFLRCLTLAQSLKALGSTVSFLYADALPWLLDRMNQAGILGYPLGTKGAPAEVDAEAVAQWLRATEKTVHWVVVDHYTLGEGWERKIAETGAKIFIIDDLARNHFCHGLLDQNQFRDAPLRYRHHLNDEAVTFFGPAHALVRPIFFEMGKRVGVRTKVEKILISFGGSDPTHTTVKAVQALAETKLAERCVAKVVLDSHHPSHPIVSALVSSSPGWELLGPNEPLEDLMAWADLSLGAAGSMTWERCATGLPAIVISVAENQRPIAEGVRAEGAILYAGHHDNVEGRELSRLIDELGESPELVPQLSRKAFSLVDPKGLGRVTAFLMKEPSCRI